MYLHIACLFSVLSIGCCFAAAQQGRPETAPLWEQYAAQPNTHPNVPNCSFAGYRYGQQPIPDRPVVVKAVDFGVTADGKADNAPAIARALKAAADAGGGAVLLPPGTIRAETPIFLRDDNVVLRGAGQDKTTLLFPKPLEKAYGRNFSGSKSAWSWSGGMVWIVPAESQPDRFAGRSNYREGWYGTKKLTKITSTHQRGQKTLTVADASGLRAGQKVLLTLADPGDFSLYSHLAGDIPGTKSYAWARQAEGIVKTDRWQWPVEIEKVSGRTITLAQPLRTDIRAAWQGELTTPGPLVVGAGVEDLTIRFPQTRLSAHLMNPGYNGIYFENAWDCWARRVTIVNTDNGIGTAASKCITVDRFTVTGRDNHHTTFCRNGSHDVLWTRFVVKSKVHHGLNIEGLSSGCVWSAGDMDHGTLDSHRALPFACIRTDIRMRNDGRHGGGSTAGPLFGARFVHWNIEVINGRAHMVHAAEMMPRGAVVGVRGTEPIEGPYPDFTGPMQSIVQADGQRVRPQDLHLAQLHLRTGKVPHHLGRHVELSLARADGKRIVLHWAEPFMTDRTYQIARKAQREAWNDDFATLAGPAWRFEDTDIQPGQNYTYRVRSVVDGQPGPWSDAQSMPNRPEDIQHLTWRFTGDDEQIRLAWQQSTETAGTVLLGRRLREKENAPFKRIATLGIDATGYVDRATQPGRWYTYSIVVENDSGQSRPVQVDAFRRAEGVKLFVEDFRTEKNLPLPAASKGEASLGQWQSRTHRAGHPSITAAAGSPLDDSKLAGELTFPSIGNQGRTFTWCEGFVADLSPVGCEVRFDYLIGRSGISTHAVGLAFRLADGSWITTEPGHTRQLMDWYSWRTVLDGVAWYSLDPQAVSMGARVADPDLSKVTGMGFYITRPINNRYMRIDNLQIWARPAK